MEISAPGEVMTDVFGAPLFLVLAMVVCLSFLTASVVVYLFRHLTRPEHAGRIVSADILMSGHRAFLFSGGKLVFATSEAETFLERLGGDAPVWDRLSAYFAEHDRGINDKLQTLSAAGTSFFCNFTDEDGVAYEVEGRPSRGYVLLTLMKLSQAKIDRLSEQSGPHLVNSSESFRDLIENVELPMWIRKPNGQMLWANTPFIALGPDAVGDAEQTTINMPAAFQFSEDEPELLSDRRVSIVSGEEPDTTQRWLNIYESETQSGNIVGYGIDAGELVKVESTLRKFVATLTESFAQLSTGLAIFDANRKLTIFNPAIADLIRIDPGWLALGPGFRDFMGRVRESQMMPEQKTTAAWKNLIQDIERGAEQGTLSDIWALPSGQTFKVTGRPHPHGAIALMIEDISMRVSLEQRYRSEIEQSRATLDYLSEAVCVFDTTGGLVYANAAFSELWGFDPNTDGDTADIVTVTVNWSEACKPSPVWGDLREFVTSLDQRASWSSDIDLHDGRTINAVFAPLPDGSTLATFSNATPSNRSEKESTRQLNAMSRAHASDISILELTIEHMKEAVETLTTALKATTEKAPQADSIDLHEWDATTYTDRLLLLRHEKNLTEENELDILSNDLLGLLREKNAELALSCDLLHDNGYMTPDVKRMLINAVLVARVLVACGENVDLSLADMKDGISLSCMFKGAADLPENLEKAAGLPYRILMRFIRERGGEGKVQLLDGRGMIKIACTIPTTAASDPTIEEGQSVQGG